MVIIRALWWTIRHYHGSWSMTKSGNEVHFRCRKCSASYYSLTQTV